MNTDKMSKVYCEYCGTSSANITSLTSNSCHHHPQVSAQEKHKLYEGSEKSHYNCKYCGTSAATIIALTGNICHRHPSGTNKGKHSITL